MERSWGVIIDASANEAVNGGKIVAIKVKIKQINSEDRKTGSEGWELDGRQGKWEVVDLSAL